MEVFNIRDVPGTVPDEKSRSHMDRDKRMGRDKGSLWAGLLRGIRRLVYEASCNVEEVREDAMGRKVPNETSF